MKRPKTHASFPKKVLHDPDTGREVWQVSPDGETNVGSYMYCRAMTPDERYFFWGTVRKGQRYLCRNEIASGEIVRMPIEGDPAFCWSLHPDGRRLFLLEPDRCSVVDVGDLHVESVLERDGRPWARLAGGVPSFSSDGLRMTFCFVTPRTTGGIARLDLTTGAVTELFVYTDAVLHMQACPADEDLISFCQWPDHQNDMDLPQEQRARTMLLDVRTGEARPWIMAPQGTRATHEWWSADGSRLYFHKKTQPGWTPAWLCSIDRRTDEVTEHFHTPSVMIGHSWSTRDDRWIVTDGQNEGRNELLLVNTRTKTAQVLCWPNASIKGGHPAYAHVHPAFSPRETYVRYSSDVTGEPQVYLVPVKDLIQEKP